MEINRNQYFMIGIVILALGIQFRMVDSVTLTEDASQFLAQRAIAKKADEGELPMVFVPAAEKSQANKRQTIKPPQWLGWALISTGAVLVQHPVAIEHDGVIQAAAEGQVQLSADEQDQVTWILGSDLPDQLRSSLI
jgi:hypothetical protein